MAEAKERGNALYKSGKFADAVKAYDESLAIDPSVASVYANKAAALSGQGRRFHAQAMEACVAAVALDPGYARAKTRLGALLSKLGDLEKATNVADALAERKDSVFSSASGVHALRRALVSLRDGRDAGNSLFKAGEKEKARNTYTEALVKAKAAFSFRNEEPVTKTEEEDAEDEDGARSLASVPGAGLLLCNRAACCSALGDHKSALEDCEAVLLNDPEYTKAALRRAHALRDLGRRDDAEAAFAELRLKLPGDANVASALNEVRGDSAETAGAVLVKSASQYRALLQRASLVLVDFTASWCGPCRQIAPHFAKLASLYPDVHFAKVDVDEVQEVAAAENVRSMPTFKVYRYGLKVEEFSGADPGKLKALVDKYLPTVA
jgi:thioredoxin